MLQTIISTDEKGLYNTHTETIAESVVTVAEPSMSIGDNNTADGATISIPGTATTGVAFSNNNTSLGEKDFGQGVDVTVSIANGTNGPQQLGRDLQTIGSGLPGNIGRAVGMAGAVAEALAPPGTIDGHATVRITGSGNVSFVSGAARGFPSYALYSYTVDANGRVQANPIKEIPENNLEDLTKPLRPIQ